MTGADDIDRLIQEVLSHLGLDENPKKIADKVKQLDQGLPKEDEFIAICSWLGRTRLVHKLDQHQVPKASGELYQVPDLLAEFEDGGPVLIEVKSRKKPKLSLKPDYLDRLNAYARLLNMPLLIAWKRYGIWVLFDVQHLAKAQKNFNITFGDAMKENLLGVLAGDVSYDIASGAGLRLRLKKEKLIDRNEADSKSMETWQVRIEEVDFMISDGKPVRNLDPEVQMLFRTWEMSKEETHGDTFIDLRFVANNDNNMMFAHMALTHLLHWSLPEGAAINWRHATRRDKVVSNMTNFRRALELALEQKVVNLILNYIPNTWPRFLPKEAATANEPRNRTDDDIPLGREGDGS